MRPSKSFFAGAAVAALLTAVALRGPVPAIAQSTGFSDDQVKSIEKVIKDYLVNNPEVLLEAQEAFERKAEAKKGEAQRSRLPEMYKSIDSMKADLANFTVGNGPVTVIEFFDYNCGYCARSLPDVVKLQEGDKNVKVLFMEFPILSTGSQEASKVAVAAAKQGKYFDFHREMFAAGRASKETALKVAEKVGLDMAKVKTDSEAPETAAFLAKIAEIGKRAFVDGTPSFFIGDRINPGAAEYDQLKQLVDQVAKEGCKSCVTAENTTGTGSAKPEKKS